MISGALLQQLFHFSDLRHFFLCKALPSLKLTSPLKNRPFKHKIKNTNHPFSGASLLFIFREGKRHLPYFHQHTSNQKPPRNPQKINGWNLRVFTLGFEESHLPTKPPSLSGDSSRDLFFIPKRWRSLTCAFPKGHLKHHHPNKFTSRNCRAFRLEAVYPTHPQLIRLHTS